MLCIWERPVQWIQSPLVASSVLYVPRAPVGYGFVWPFVPLYAGWGYLYFAQFESVFGSAEFANLALILLAAAQALMALSTQWSVKLRGSLTSYPMCFSVVYYTSGMYI